MISWFKQRLTGVLVRYLTGKVRKYESFAISPTETLESVLEVADVILVEGNQRFSTAVKYLTQSTWSHAAIYVGYANSREDSGTATPSVIEADQEDVPTLPDLEDLDVDLSDTDK